MISAYVPVLVHLTLAVLLAVALLGLHRLAGGRRPTLEKSLPYESGVWPIGGAQERVPIRYYLVAMLFILFDIEIVFLYPLAVILHALAWFGFVEFLFFIVILALAYVYVWRKGALDWQ